MLHELIGRVADEPGAFITDQEKHLGRLLEFPGSHGELGGLGRLLLGRFHKLDYPWPIRGWPELIVEVPLELLGSEAVQDFETGDEAEICARVVLPCHRRPE